MHCMTRDTRLNLSLGFLACGEVSKFHDPSTCVKDELIRLMFLGDTSTRACYHISLKDPMGENINNNY